MAAAARCLASRRASGSLVLAGALTLLVVVFTAACAGRPPATGQAGEAPTATPAVRQPAVFTGTPPPPRLPVLFPTPRLLATPESVRLAVAAACHDAPSADSAVIVRLEAGATVETDQIITLLDSIWRRARALGCWLRSDVAGVENLPP